MANIVLAAFASRFARRSALLAPLRRDLGARSKWLRQLFACPHCLCFWFALAGGALLGRNGLQLGIATLLGWRGGYYLNRLIDHLAAGFGPSRAERACRVCGRPYEAGFLQRQGEYYCSYHCWFDYLKDLRRSQRPLLDEEGHFIRQEIYPMSIKTIDPTRAKELLDSGEGYVYIDVRSIPEYEAGHPAGALNIPILHKEAMGLVPNPDFVRVVEKIFPRDAKILLGCQVGARSQRAAEALVAAGFTDVSNVMGGFGGTRDPMGRVVEKGWAELGLPVERGSADGRDYPSLAARIRG